MATPEDRPLDWNDIRNSAAAFVKEYRNAKSESSDKQLFWRDFFQMFGVSARQVGTFEDHVKKLGGTDGAIDYFWPGKLIIEHKSRGADLDKAYQQALDYTVNLSRSESPKYIIVSDFARIRLTDVEERRTVEIRLEDLYDNVELFGFIAGYNKTPIVGQHPVNVKAAAKMGDLYDQLKVSNYPESDIDKFLIRLVFCMFAEDSGIFERGSFVDYVKNSSSEDGTGTGSALNTLFDVLNTPVERRQTGMSERLRSFPYVNGGLFADRIETAFFDRKMRDTLIDCANLDWREISPAIFGSLFQCIMDPEMRRSIGAHYTSEENILKLINALFMDDMRARFDAIVNSAAAKGTKRKRLEALWDEIAGLKIMDPACGCGNFLIIAYRELRLLEMDIMDAIYGSQAVFDTTHISVANFYGMELKRFPVQIANTSILLMEHLMNIQAEKRFGVHDDIIPLTRRANVVCSNSLMADWGELCPPEELSYIIGNPPFVGAKYQSEAQRSEMKEFFKGKSTVDYVAAWYVKASRMMSKNPRIRTAFVSTNSITQGEQVEPIWRPILESGCHIDFAYRTFKWSNEAKGVAAVHVVIIGFSHCDVPKRIYVTGEDGGVSVIKARNINPYLVDGRNVFLLNRKKPICDIPEMKSGSQPIDDGNYLFDRQQMEDFIRKEPASAKYFHPWVGSEEYINGIERFCLWLGDCSPSELRSMPECMKRVEAVRTFRSNRKRKQTLRCAETPTHFCLEVIAKSPYLVVPKTSSENRRYVPIGYMTPDTLAGDAVFLVEGITDYHFGVLTSEMHMTWMRYVCGRLKSDYRYSIGIVYNNFPWPTPTETQRKKIEDAARNVLDVRARYPDQSYADLYDQNTMPADLLRAHQALDREVDRAYRSAKFEDEGQRMSFLLDLYGKLIDE